MSRKQCNKPETITEVEEPVMFTEEHISEPEPPAEPVYGKVAGCERLNVRTESTKDSDVACVINEGTEVMVDLDDSTVDWYKVCLADGIEGYCLAEFIRID